MIQVNSDLQALEDSFCETVDVSVAMETAQEMLDRFQPLAAGLRENYTAMKEQGELNGTTDYAMCSMTQLH